MPGFCLRLRRVDDMRDFLKQWVGMILILLGLARAALVVMQDPMAGYANQYDMHRTSACIGFFPAAEAAATVATPEAPISRYALTSRTDGCYQSAEVGIAAVAVAIASATGADPGRISLKYVGYVKLAVLFVTALLLAWLLREHPAASATHGLVVLLILADPVVTLWMNTLYTEFATIWSLYAVMGAACVLALYDRFSILGWLLLLAGLIVLAVAREQFALLGPAMVVAAWPWLWHNSRHLTVAAIVVSLVAAFAGLFALPRPIPVTKANRADTYLHLLIPASSSPERGLATLGLPDTCAPLVGATWYRQRGESIDKSCPQVYALSSFAFLRMASDEPRALARAAARALPSTQGIAPVYLGTLEGQRNKTIDEMPWWGFSPLRVLDAALPLTLYAALTLAMFLLAPAGLVTLLVMRRYRGEPLAPLLLAMLLGGTALYSFLTAILGDGMNEAARHYLPGTLAMYAALLMAIAGIGMLLMRWKETPREAVLEIAAGATVIALAAFGVAMAMHWMRAQPGGIGVLDLPVGRYVPTSGFSLRGWALDPSGVEAVNVRVGSIEKAARFGEPSPESGLLRVRSLFAGYRDAKTAGFALDLTADDLAKAGAPNPLTLKVLVQGRNGAVTEIDRRNLEFPVVVLPAPAPSGSDPIQAPKQ
jgi:hypothetical protein